MGGSSSKTNTNVSTKLAVEAITNTIMNCTSNSLISQKFLIEGNYNVVTNFKQVQNFKLSTECTNNAQSIANLQQSVAQAIKAASESQSVSVLGVLGGSNSETNVDISTEVSQKITNNTITNIINNTNAEQEAIIRGNHNIIDNFSQEQTSEILSKNAQKALNKLTSVQSVSTQVDATSKATQTNFISDIVDSVFSGLQGFALIWVIVIVVAIIFLGKPVLSAMTFGMSNDTSSDGTSSSSSSVQFNKPQP